METCTNLPDFSWACRSPRLPKGHEALAHPAYVEGTKQAGHQNKDLAKNRMCSVLEKSSKKKPGNNDIELSYTCLVMSYFYFELQEDLRFGPGMA